MKRILLFLLLFVNLQMIMNDNSFSFSIGATASAQRMIREIEDGLYLCEDEETHEEFESSLSTCGAENGDQYRCPYCYETFFSDCERSLHIEEECKMKPEKCIYCKTEMSREECIEHEASCPYRPRCRYCGEYFDSNGDLTYHERRCVYNPDRIDENPDPDSRNPDNNTQKKPIPTVKPKIEITIAEGVVFKSPQEKDLAMKILKRLGLEKVTVTSASRTPESQARSMLNNIKKSSVEQQKKLYGSNGDKVIDVYDPKLSDSQNYQNMLNKIYELGPGNVSKHCSENGVGVVDIGISTISDPEATVKALEGDSSVTGAIDERPYGINAIHIVFDIK